MRSCLRLTAHILKTKHEFKFAALNMSSQKRNSDGFDNNGTPTKLRRGQLESTRFIQEKLTHPKMTINNIEMSSVEVMEAPDKPEYDKKSYRVIRLVNGLKALLISDPIQERSSNDEQNDNVLHESVTASDDENEINDDDGGDDDAAADEDSCSEQSDDDDENENDNSKKSEIRGKLAACSLCVDVGSFSDPRDIQGLAHFLGMTKKNTHKFNMF